MRAILTGLATLALAACGTAPQENVANATNNAVAANDAEAVNYIAEISNLSEQEQQGVFFRAIRDADIPCRDVTKVEKIEPMMGVPTWRASCDQGDQHLIQVKPDGSAQVISRTTR
jgi:hypothetical protein